MNIQTHLERITNYLQFANSDKEIEMEVKFKDSFKEHITNDNFIRILKRIKGIAGIIEHTPDETLDMNVKIGKTNNSSVIEYSDMCRQPGCITQDIRVTIKGSNHVKRYCNSNKLEDIDPKNISMIKKKILYQDESSKLVTTNVKRGRKLLPININDYKMKVNLKTEHEISYSSKEIKAIYENWLNKQKSFRYKKRYSFTTSDKLFRYDLTILKTSNSIEIKKAQPKVIKRDVDLSKKRFIQVPKDKKFEDWWDTLDDDYEVEFKPIIYYNYETYPNMQTANILNMPVIYEVEMEYIGNKSNISKSIDETLESMIKYMGIVLQAIQQSYYLTAETDKQLVKQQLNKLLGSYTFAAPMNVTLEKKHIIKRPYSDYKNNIVSIRRGYSVTDKADGERNLLVILDDGRIFLVNRNTEIKYLGASLEGAGGTIIDGEYITTGTKVQNMSLYMAFDIYFLNGEDIRDRVLMRDVSNQGVGEESRLELLKKFIETITLTADDDVNPIEIYCKTFYYGDFYSNKSETATEIDDLLKQQLDEEPGSDTYTHYEREIQKISPDDLIFKEATLFSS